MTLGIDKASVRFFVHRLRDFTRRKYTIILCGLWILLAGCRPSSVSSPPRRASSLPAQFQLTYDNSGTGPHVAFYHGLVTADSLENVKDWSKVVSLRLQECDEVDAGLWNKLAQAKSLKKLEFIQSPIRDDHLQQVAYCTELEELLLAHTQVTGEGLQYLTALPLRRLAIHTRQATQAGIRHVASITSLRELELHCPELELAGMPSLASLHQLELLNSGRTKLGHGGLKILENHPTLKFLVVNAMGMDDSQIPILNTIPQLTDLTLAGASITNQGLKQLNCPNLKRLFLDTCTQITDEGLYNLAGAPALEELLLMGTSVHGLDLMGLVESQLFKLRRVFMTAEQYRGGQRSIDALHKKLPDCQVIITQG